MKLIRLKRRAWETGAELELYNYIIERIKTQDIIYY